MKTKTTVAMTAILMSAGLVFAADPVDDHQAHHPESAAATAQQPPAMHDCDMQMMKMFEKMQTQMAEIGNTDDPIKRDVLMQSQMADMQAMMKMMQGMHDMHGDESMMKHADMMAAPPANTNGGQ